MQLDCLRESRGHAPPPAVATDLPSTKPICKPTDPINVWVHFGVDSKATEFRLENRAANDASFRIPDQKGWQPQGEAIVKGAPVSLCTTLPIDHLVSRLSAPSSPVADVKCPSDTSLVGTTKAAAAGKAVPVRRSEDAGRFVCNWIYYQSLWRSANSTTQSLFVHVPPHSVADLAAQQEFTIRLFNELSNLLLHPPTATATTTSTDNVVVTTATPTW